MTPLAGLHVLDLSRLLPGAYASMVLADLGADVVKVESPRGGDGLRLAPPYGPDGDGALHLALDRGKRSVTVDLRADGGLDAVRDLAARADVLLDSFRPGVLDATGLAPAALRARNAGLVHVSLVGHSVAGADAARAGHDITYVGAAGLLGLNGDPASGPRVLGAQVADICGGLWAVTAVLAGLRGRDTTGVGSHTEVSLEDAALSAAVVATAPYAVDGRTPTLGGEWFNGGLAGYGTYRCADGRWIAVGALEPKFFVALCRGIGRPDLVERHGDLADQDALRSELAAVFATRTRDEWLRDLADVDTCVGPVNDVGEALDAGRRRGVVADVDGFAQVLAPLLVDGQRLGSPRPAPRLGADAEDVLGTTSAGRTSP
jgi:alpha-methylacyl-CoA racemase